jgi:outer membrane receptor protein involved in Fe transport
MAYKFISVGAVLLLGLNLRTELASGQEQPTVESAASHTDTLEELTGLDEIMVTANKIGVERLKDVPLSITVIDQNRIEQAGIDDFLDYVRTVPGLGFQLTTPAGGRDDIRGARRFSLRGIESGYDSVPTTAFYLDETPIPIMDPKLFDIERIEVLRGPQGTLYGANSMGGTIRVVTHQPVLDEFHWTSDVSLESTHAGEESYGLNGLINFPLITDRAAIRAAAFYRNDGGYIDQYFQAPQSTGATSVRQDGNNAETRGGRILGLFKVTDQFQLTPAIFRQQIDVADAGTFEPDFRDLGRAFLSVYPERQTNDFTLYSLGASYDLSEHLQIVSSSAYFDSDFTSIEEATKGFFDFGGTAYGNAFYSNLVKTQRKNQELRLAYKGPRWHGIVGAYYMNEERFFSQYGDTEASGVWFTYLQKNGDEQKALFGEAALHLTDRFTATAGARWFQGQQDQYTLYTYSLDFPPGDPPFVQEFSGKADGNSFSPKFQLSYDLSPEKMVYASAARGFRPGGPTSLVPDTPECLENLQELGLSRPQREFGPDNLWNYELGSKSSFANHRITINAAVYYVDWKEVQQTASLACGFTFVGNVGAAKSKGIELEFWTQPFRPLSISGSLGYTDAQFTRTAAAVGIVAGDRIPLVPRITGSAAVQYALTTPNGRTAFVRGDYQYIGAMAQGGFSRSTRPAYDSFNLRLGAGLSDHTDVTLFVNNVLDERGVLSGYIPPDEDGLGGVIPAQFLHERTVVRPRTMGISIRYRR